MAPRRRNMKSKPRRGRKGRKTGKMSNNTKVTTKMVFKQSTPITITAAVTASLGNYVWNAWSPQNSQYVTVTQSAEFQAQSKLYDEMNVSMVKYTYKPFANVQSLLQQNSTTPVVYYDTNFYSFVDRDGSNPISTSTNAIQKVQSYDSCKIHSYYKKWTRVLRKKAFWTDTNNPTINPASSSGLAQPWINAGACQILGLYAQQLPLSTVGQLLGEVNVEYHVQFRGKKPALFAYDQSSGSVIITPTTSYNALAPNNPPHSLLETCGDEHLDISGDAIIVVSDIDGAVAHAP